MPCGFLWQPVCSVVVVILRFVMASAGVLFVGSTGAFFLLVPVFSILTVASILVGLLDSLRRSRPAPRPAFRPV